MSLIGESDSNHNSKGKVDRQEGLYSHPYHYLPHEHRGVWRVSKSLFWGYEYLAILNTILSLVRERNPSSILDFGCGDGRLLHELSRDVPARLVGVDTSRRALSLARSMNMGPHGENKMEFGTSLDQIEGIFDVVTTVETLEHIPDEELPSVLTLLHEKLHEKGCLIVSVPTLNVPLNPKHYRHYEIEELTKQIKGFFRPERVLYVHRRGLLSVILRKMVHNRFMTAECLSWLSLTTWFYKRFLLQASPNDGAHLIALLKKG